MSVAYNSMEPEQEPHIRLNENIDPETFALLERMCPAQLYWQDENGMHYDYTGCLECGVCRIIGGEEAFILWRYPAGGKGVDYSNDKE